MKKILYFMTLASLLLVTSCNKWDAPVTESFGSGPSVAIQLVSCQDSSYTFTVTPASTAKYYSYAVVEGEYDEDITAESVYKGTVSGAYSAVIKTADEPSTEVTITSDPNISYVIYAVAGDSNGILGTMETLEVSTTDGVSPYLESWEADADAGSITLTFSEEIEIADTTAYTTYFYKEWNADSVRDATVNIVAGTNTVTVTFPDLVAGEIAAFGIGKGFVKDLKGNVNSAVTSKMNDYTGKISGPYVQKTYQSWEISEDDVVSPEDGYVFADYSEFKVVFKFEFDIYRNDYSVKDGDIQVKYYSKSKQTIINLPVANWTVQDSTLTVTLSEAPAAGDYVGVIINEGVLFDVYGNPNSSYETTNDFSWALFVPSVEDITGTFNWQATSYFDKDSGMQDYGNIIIALDESTENGLTIYNMFRDNTVLSATYDLTACKIYVPSGQFLCYVTSSSTGTKYQAYLFSAVSADNIVFTINADGTITADAMYGFYLFDESGETQVGWNDVITASSFIKATSAAKSYKMSTTFSKKTSKTVSKKINKSLSRHIRVSK